MPSATNTTVNERQKTIGGHQHPRSAVLALAQLGDRDARDGREVARHERQHAGGDERDEADREGGDRPWCRRRTRECTASAVEAREVVVEPARVLGVGSGVTRRGSARRRRPAASRRRRQRGTRETRSPATCERDDGDRHEVDGEVEALVLGQREHARRRTRPTSRVLDLRPWSRPWSMRPRMNARSRSAWRRLGEVQRRAAHHAHDLVLDVGQRRARGGRAGRRGHGEREQHEPGQRERPPHPQQRRERLVHRAAADHGAAALGDDPPVAVDHEGLGQRRRAVVLASLPVDVAHARVGQPYWRIEALGVPLVSR